MRVERREFLQVTAASLLGAAPVRAMQVKGAPKTPGWGSNRTSPGGRRRTAAGWARSAGSWSGRWIKGLRRLRVRYDRPGVIMDAWTTLATSVICSRYLHQMAP
jgi:hypothetical protein